MGKVMETDDQGRGIILLHMIVYRELVKQSFLRFLLRSQHGHPPYVDTKVETVQATPIKMSFSTKLDQTTDCRTELERLKPAKSGLGGSKARLLFVRRVSRSTRLLPSNVSQIRTKNEAT
jgi:hypothetical protein